MRKIGIVIFCVSLCIAVAFILPHSGKTTEFVDDKLCLTCHDHDDFKSDHDNDCDRCHAEGFTAPPSETCIKCHPSDDPGECNLVDFHYDTGADCLNCHSECEEDTTTTTTPPDSTTTTTTDSSTTTTATDGCPSEELYGENSEEVEILRYFRDSVLNTTPEGQETIRLYYQWSPVIVKSMEEDEEFKEEMKEMIDGFLLLITEEK